VDEKGLFERLDKIIALLDTGLKPASKAERIVGWVATAVAIMGLLAIIDIVISWIGG